MSKSDDLSKPRLFSGTLSQNGNELRLDVRISVDASGEITLGFDPIPLTDESKFLLTAFYHEGSRRTTLRFAGIAPDQTRFETDDLHLNRCSHSLDASGHRVEIVGSCLTAVFHRPLTSPASLPVLQMHLRGFRNFPSHQTTCRLGTVALAGNDSGPDLNLLSGKVSIHASTVPENIEAWREEAGRLSEHIRRVMSIAAASLLRAPIVEFFAGTEVEVKAWSQTQASAALPTIHFMRQEGIFTAAVESFFNPPVAANRVFFAIEWLVMEGTYNEIRLVCAMTALENLIDSNLDPSEALIETPAVFKKTRRILRDVIRKCLAEWSPARAADALLDLDEKLAELNRRPLLRKLDTLARCWQVPLDGISDESLRAAVQARNRVVHRGQYYEDMKPEDADLWTHVTVIREVVVRFLLTAIGYRGEYISYVGHPHDAKFPPSPLAA